MVVVGRSDSVGKPLAIMLVQRGVGADATVTVCHSRTTDLPSFTRQADILVAAMRQPRLHYGRDGEARRGRHRRGHSSRRGKLVGDVDFAGVSQVAGYITPVPGGVGPLTVTMLLANTLTAARLQE